MQELDKLERSMNSEACALVLAQIDGPRRTTRKPSKYTFTIKVVEAEDLKACDPSGYSDPYVVFGDEYQKRLYKTRVIYRNLNPRWDESFDITVQGPVNFIATAWNHDTFGDHDYVGRTALKLDPVHFGDYLPREFWLDLDSQGRLLIRVSMEGERDDIEFHFGKAFRHLKRTERDMVRKITDKVRGRFPLLAAHREWGTDTEARAAHVANQLDPVTRDAAGTTGDGRHRCLGDELVEEAVIGDARDDAQSDRGSPHATVCLL